MNFALITEGASEYRVIKHIILRYFKDAEPIINQIQPKIVKDKQVSIGGWNEVLKYCEREELEDILIENDYLVIQIDTDQSQTAPFDVSHTDENNKKRTDEELHTAVIQKLTSLIRPEILEESSDKIFFAVCIHTIECWLLPIFYSDHNKSKTNNCLSVLNKKLRQKNMKTIAESSKNSPNGVISYGEILNSWKRKKHIISSAKNRYAFNYFVESLDSITP